MRKCIRHVYEYCLCNASKSEAEIVPENDFMHLFTRHFVTYKF